MEKTIWFGNISQTRHNKCAASTLPLFSLHKNKSIPQYTDLNIQNKTWTDLVSTWGKAEDMQPFNSNFYINIKNLFPLVLDMNQNTNDIIILNQTSYTHWLCLIRRSWFKFKSHRRGVFNCVSVQTQEKKMYWEFFCITLKMF